MSSASLIQSLNSLNRQQYGLTQAVADPLFTVSGRVLGRFGDYSLDSAFQPIYDVKSGELVAYEALLRATDGEGQKVSPEKVFRSPTDAAELVFLDRLCRTVHILNYLEQTGSSAGFLYLNLDPRHVLAVADHGLVFEGILRQSGLSPNQVVIELLEHASEDYSSLKRAVDNFKSRGFHIAIDDFGRGHANFDRLWELEPDVVKFDRHLVSSAADDPRLAAVLPKLVEVAKARGARVLFEGIERQCEFDLALSSGGDLVQGFLLGHPEPDCAPASRVIPRAPRLSVEAV